MSTESNNGSAEGVVESIADLGNNIATLAELQLQLAALDWQESTAKAMLPLGACLVSLTLLLGSVPVLIGGLALFIAATWNFSVGLTLLSTALVLMILAGIVVAVAGRRLGTAMAGFRRSQEELTRNVAWIRTVLVHSGRAASSRR